MVAVIEILLAYGILDVVGKLWIFWLAVCLSVLIHLVKGVRR